MSEQIILVSTDDTQVGTLEKYTAHQNPPKRHRAISVWLTNARGEVLFQQRSSKKIVGALWWANTVCGNVWDGETYEACAIRRLKGELGISVDQMVLKKGEKFEYKAFCNQQYSEHEVDQIFFMNVDDVEVIANPDEVSDYSWISLEELKKVIQAAVSEQGYYTLQTSLEASWNELAENMQPLPVLLGGKHMKLAPWTVMMLQAGLAETK